MTNNEGAGQMETVILSENEAREVRALLLDLQQTATPADAARVHDALLALYPPGLRIRVEQIRAFLAKHEKEAKR